MNNVVAALNGPAVGIILKELVRRAIVTIRNERQVFDVSRKAAYGGAMNDMNDVFTSADRKAQEIYLKLLRECFPDHGIVAEEDALTIPAKNGTTGYFTVDPLDGTKAFIRRQSHGVGTMVALVEDRHVIAAYVGDVNTQEVYGYRQGSRRVHRITEFETSEELAAKPSIPAERYILLRDPERAYSPAGQQLISRFKSFEVEGGSIGTWLARLWKDEIGAALLPPGFETPWDSSPIIGISKTLGFAFYRPDGNRNGWERFEPRLPLVPERRAHDMLVIHPATFAAM